MAKYSIWIEGYRGNPEWGEDWPASYEGDYEANSLDEAVQKHVDSLDEKQQKYWKRDNDGNWTMWGLQVYDNEEEALRRNG